MTPREIRDQLTDNGWHVVPVVPFDAAHKSPGKAAIGIGWTALCDAPATEDQLDSWDRDNRYPIAEQNTGLALTRGLVAIDLDYTDAELAQTMLAKAIETFGYTPFQRQGQAPKVALLYRVDEPVRNSSVKTCGEQGVDILAHGRHLCSYGTHPKTEKPYAWLFDNPLDATPDELPVIKDAQATVTRFLSELQPGVAAPAADNDDREGKATRLTWSEYHRLLEESAAGHVTFVNDKAFEAALMDRVWTAWVSPALNIQTKDPRKTLAQEGRGEKFITAKVREVVRRHYKPHVDGPADPLPSRDLSSATPYVWTDPAAIPPRQWLYGRHYVRGFVTATVAPGGVGKSSHALVEAVSMVAGIDLLGGRAPMPRRRVWYVNLEDGMDELKRRIQAIARHFSLEPASLEGLYVNSGRDVELVIARTIGDQVSVNEPVFEAIQDTIYAQQIDCMIVDPFVHSHEVNENVNTEIARVMDLWRIIAEVQEVSIELIHHTRKLNGAEVSAEDTRGAGAMVGAARSVRAMQKATKDTAAKLNVADDEIRNLFFFGAGDKINMAPPPNSNAWRKLVSVSLGNVSAEYPDGDSIGVVEAWREPDIFDGVTSQDLFAIQRAMCAADETRVFRHPSSTGWFGYLVADVCDLHVKDDRRRLVALIDTWEKSGAIVETEAQNKQRQSKPAYAVGSWVVL
jgi:hypothetical protein